MRQRDALKLLWGVALGSVVYLGFTVYGYSESANFLKTMRIEREFQASPPDPKTNELEPKAYGWSGEFTKWKAEKEIERENARKKRLRRDTYNQIRELQKEFQEIDPDYQPDDGALQWREAGKDFAKHISNQLHELQKEMRRIDPDYRSCQGSPQDEDAKSESDSDALHKLQRALRKMNPDYQPGWGVFDTVMSLNKELCDVSHAVIKSRRPPVKSMMKPPIKPDINSEDAVESLAARFQDPELRQHYRSGWDFYGMQSYQKDDIREMVDDHMGVFGIKWPKEGNPFGTDDEDDI